QCLPRYAMTIFCDETTQLVWGDVRKVLQSDPHEVGGELIQMESVLIQRSRTKSLLVGEIRKELRRLSFKRIGRPVGTTATNVTRYGQAQHLANGVAGALADLLARPCRTRTLTARLLRN